MRVQSLNTTSPVYDAYVSRGRERFAGLFPDGTFDACKWETRALAATTAASSNTLYFTRYGSRTEELPRIFSEPVKAWVASDDQTSTNMRRRLVAARWLWHSVEQRLGPDAASAFAWSDLRHADLLTAEQLMIDEGLAPKTIRNLADALANLAKDFALTGISPAIAYVPITPWQQSVSRHRVDNPEARGSGVLTAAAVAALADIFQRAVTVRDRFYSALMALLIAAGLRWNEAVTLPLDPLVDQEIETRDVTGATVRVHVTFLRRHKAKSKRAGGAGRPNSELEPLTKQQAELATLAVSVLTEILAESRSVAARLEQTAPRWVWPYRLRPQYIRESGITAALGVGGSRANRILRKIGELDPETSPSGRYGTRSRTAVEALEQYMTDRQDWSLLDVVKPTPSTVGQRASESLLCVRVYELNEAKATLPLIGAPSCNRLSEWLTGHSQGTPSVFERFEKEFGVRYREPDGSIVRITSHMCRRLFVTTGLTAGATVVDMARWQGREHIGDLSSYDQRSMAEKIALVKDAIMTGRLRGQIAQAYVSLAEDVRDVWLEGQVHAVHVTPLGLCVHDFSATPCPLHLNCLKGDGCSDYLHDPTDAEQVQVLVQLKRRTQETMDHMQPAIERGQIAEGWVHEQEATLRNIARTLEAKPSDAGTHVQPFAENVSRFQPLAAEA